MTTFEEQLAARCDQYGLPHDFDVLMRHMDANRGMTEAALKISIDILQKRVAKSLDVIEAAKVCIARNGWEGRSDFFAALAAFEVATE